MDEDTEMADSSDVKVNPITEKQIVGQHSTLRPMSERFNEQIAEDIVYDLVDEGKDGTSIERFDAACWTGSSPYIHTYILTIKQWTSGHSA